MGSWQRTHSALIRQNCVLECWGQEEVPGNVCALTCAHEHCACMHACACVHEGMCAHTHMCVCKCVHTEEVTGRGRRPEPVPSRVQSKKIITKAKTKVAM